MLMAGTSLVSCLGSNSSGARVSVGPKTRARLAEPILFSEEYWATLHQTVNACSHTALSLEESITPSTGHKCPEGGTTRRQHLIGSLVEKLEEESHNGDNGRMEGVDGVPDGVHPYLRVLKACGDRKWMTWVGSGRGLQGLTCTLDELVIVYCREEGDRQFPEVALEHTGYSSNVYLVDTGGQRVSPWGRGEGRGRGGGG